MGETRRKGAYGASDSGGVCAPAEIYKGLLDREDIFTLSVFGGGYRRALAYMGTHSGRDGDKVTEAGLIPEFVDGTVCFAEAEK